MEGVNIIDGNSQKILFNQTILIKGEKIEQIFPTDSRQMSDSVTVINLHGKFVIPGLIDTHVHLTKDSRATSEMDLEKMLFSGITSVRDMAGDVRTIASLSRDALVKDIISPNIYFSALMAGPKFFKDPRAKLASIGGVAGEMSYMRAITDSSNLELVIAEAKGTGATGIKLLMHISKGLTVRIVNEAKKQNIQVWGHAALFPATAIEVVNAGVSVVSHADGLIPNAFGKIPESWKKRENPESSDQFWDDEIAKLKLDSLLNLMRDKGTIFDATLSSYLKSIQESPGLKWKWEIVTRITEKAHLTGVKICTGTDTDQEIFVQEEIKILVKYCGFSPMDALIAATKNGAEAIGILKTHGTLEVGKFADIVILDKNPLDNIQNIDKVLFVVKGGKIYNK